MWEPAGRPKLPDPPDPPDLPTPVPPSKSKPSHAMTKRPPQGAMTKAQRSVSPAEEAAFAAIEAEMGGRARLVSALGSAQLPKDVSMVLGMIADPMHDHESLAKICALGGVSLAKLQKTFEAAVRARAHVIAHARIAEKAPDLAAAVMEDSIPGWRPCRECDGFGTKLTEVKDAEGTREEPRPCPSCKGKGRVWFVPDHEMQKTALKISGLLESGSKGRGDVNLAVLQANTTNNPGNPVNFDQLMGKLDAVLYGSGRDRLTKSRQTALEADPEEAEVIDGDVAESE